MTTLTIGLRSSTVHNHRRAVLPAAARRHPMLDLLNPDTLNEVVAEALTDTATVLVFTDGRSYTVTVRPALTSIPARAVTDALGGWIAGHIRACLAATVLDAAVYQVTVTPLGRFSESRRAA